MKSLHLAGAVALCAVLVFTGCAKKTGQSTDTPTTTAVATTAPIVTLAGGYIVIPVYPGATLSTNDERTAGYDFGPLVAVKIYSTKDDAKRVADWYKAHLPSSWDASVTRGNGKTVGTFSEERKDGGIQSVIAETWNNGTTRIQIATNHNKAPRGSR